MLAQEQRPPESGDGGGERRGDAPGSPCVRHRKPRPRPRACFRCMWHEIQNTAVFMARNRSSQAAGDGFPLRSRGRAARRGSGVCGVLGMQGALGWAYSSRATRLSS